MAALMRSGVSRIYNLFDLSRRLPQFTCIVATAKVKAGVGAPTGKKEYTFQPETDPEKLVNYCCGANIYKEGEEIKLKPHSEYPDWLWDMRLERGAIPLEELEYGSPEFWRRYRQIAMREKNFQTKLKRKRKIIRVK